MRQEQVYPNNVLYEAEKSDKLLHCQPSLINRLILIYIAMLCVRASVTLWPQKVLFLLLLFRPPPISNVLYLLSKNKKFPKGKTLSYLGLKARIARTEKLE